MSSPVESQLAASEAGFVDLVPGTEKKIVWADGNQGKTPFALVYLHGFSATRQEVFPLCDRIAASLGANLYYARLTGHGRSGAALALATVNDWLKDAAEAMAIGQEIGERVIVIGTSTGGTLATWLALQPGPRPYACILLSPNFGPKDPNAQYLTYPWATQLLPLFFGRERHRNPQSEAEKKYWTNIYPTSALIPMMGLVTTVGKAKLEDVRTPTLVIMSPDDQVVDPQATERAFARFGAKQKRLVRFEDRLTLTHHVIAGDIMAPANTAPIAEMIVGFVSDLDRGGG